MRVILVADYEFNFEGLFTQINRKIHLEEKKYLIMGYIVSIKNDFKVLNLFL